MKKSRIFLLISVILLVAYYFCLPKKLFDVPYSTAVFDRNGELLGARIATDGQWRFPPNGSVAYNAPIIPSKYETCLLAFEDRHFRQHWGVNPASTYRALIQNIKQKRVVSGGSTITMQVIRLSRKKPRTIGEKLWEMVLATRLEFRCSKNEILALYASHAPFGSNVVGIDAAAFRYFGHSAAQLSWAEAATLAVLPNAPSQLHISKNRTKLLEKRNRLLRYLFSKNKLSQTDFELALQENLPDQTMPLPQIAPHLVSRFYAKNRGKNLISTIDKSTQIKVENLLEKWNVEFLQSGICNLAAIVIDVQTNETLAYCGNVDFFNKKNGNQVDIIQAQRSSGSILKPFLYEAMLAEGNILPNRLVADIPLNINGFAPENFNRNFEGAVPASQAVSRSLNVPLVLMLKDYGVPKFYNYLKNNKIAALPENSGHYGLSLILGGAEVALENVTIAYANMARVLLNEKPTFCKILKNENTKEIAATFDNGAVWQVFEAIKEVNRPEEIDLRAVSTMQNVAWKTGTSFGFRDAWAVGVMPRYAVGVWAGNASGEGKPNLVGARTAGLVLFDIFDVLPASSWFECPSGKFVEAVICKKSGFLAGRYCSETDTVLALPQGLRTKSCPFHVLLNLSFDERYRLNADCAASEPTLQKEWFVLPPAWAYYYQQYHPEYQALPPLRHSCSGSENAVMQFIYPQEKTSSVSLPKQLDGTSGEITFRLAHTDRNAVVFWHIDENYIAQTADVHTFTIPLSAGWHKITAVDNAGNRVECRVDVR
ncbi:MAG: penicillin-binding protein 1C [Prevotellaceae bacterium]|jgi:penicillin-binding protein 1C|nr:penicillin-binding protein 1C [Prevotellaceae bacterium]